MITNKIKFWVAFKQKNIINERINPIGIIRKILDELIFKIIEQASINDNKTQEVIIMSNNIEADPFFKGKFFCFFRYIAFINSPDFIGNKILNE